MNYYKRFACKLYILIIPIIVLIVLPGCKKPHSDIGATLFKITKNKVYKSITAEQYTEALKNALNNKTVVLAHPEIIKLFYEQADYEPVFIKDQLENGNIDSAISRLAGAESHGLDRHLFQADELDTLLHKLKSQHKVTTPDEACKDIAKLELMLANSVINYANAMQYGIISPRKIYARYFTKTLRPDSASMRATLKSTNLKAYLDSIQPKNEQYKALQKALIQGYAAPGISKEETQRILIVNLERLRWKNKPDAGKYVVVNIPAYQLDVIEAGKSTLNMKVCVGEGRNKDQENTLVEYDESDKTDRPFSRETPQLSSMIYEAQVNPVWNIPQSIASKEIIKLADKDPYYLSNKGIDVYKNGKKVEDTETIDWGDSNVASIYSFKQRPGDANSLGKIKFLFPNQSSVYLHDTPAKDAFNSSMRAISHGCVRLEKPQDFAKALFGPGSKYNLIVKDMAADKPEPTDIALPKKVPVFITYITCWQDSQGNLKFVPDVYGLDIVLFGQMQKLTGTQKSRII